MYRKFEFNQVMTKVVLNVEKDSYKKEYIINIDFILLNKYKIFE